MRDPGRAVPALAAATFVTLLLAGCEGQPGEPDPTPTTSSTTSVAPWTPPSSSASSAPATSMTPLPQEFDHAAMQDSVHQVLSESYRIEKLELVICPPHKPVQKGVEFSCTATIDGKKKKVPIRVTSDDGDYKVDYPR